uniref:Uncharacterized protein n=1 Tax=Falco tinnunculus TaxID=100819 RepID=A0A8C4US63_FALTI
TGFKSLVTFDSCKNYKQRCMFSYLQKCNRQPCKNTTEARLSRDVTKTGRSVSWSKGTEENIAYFECVQHREANGRNVYVEIRCSQGMKTTLKLSKDHRKILELTEKFYQAEKKERKVKSKSWTICQTQIRI